MKINFANGLLWLIPYLYLTSITYYLGYWGGLGVDAFNYYAVSDLVKGVTYPISSAIFYTCTLLPVFIMLFIISNFIFNKALSSKWSSNAKSLFTTLGMMSALSLNYLFIRYGQPYFFEERINTVVSKPGSNLFTTNALWLCISAMIGYAIMLVSQFRLIMNGFKKTLKAIEQSKPLPEKPTFNFLMLPVFTLIIFIPGRSFITGRENAHRILLGKEFDYIVKDSLILPQKQIYKYLGKAGDYYVISSLKGTKKAILKCDKLNPIIIDKFSLEGVREWPLTQQQTSQ